MTEQNSPQTPETGPYGTLTWDGSSDLIITAAIMTPPIITIRGESAPLVTIHPDGRLEYGPGYEPDEAARQFWLAMQRYAPSPMEQQFGRPLAETINADLARGQEAQRMLDTLAPMFEGLTRLIATSSRDWSEYRVDAWLWAVLVGWECEHAGPHDEACLTEVLEEVAAIHGWDEAAITKARRYRDAVRAIAAKNSEAGR